MDAARMLDELRTQHWTSAIGDPAEIEITLVVHGLAAARTQRGHFRQVLRPASAGDAAPNTMSAIFGNGEQPLHTDGAHLQQPPDVILLASAEPNLTPTRVWSGAQQVPGTSAIITNSHPEFARHGLFVVRNGRDSFLSPAFDWMRLRVDPACMSPADGYARQAAEYFQNLPAFEFHWDVPQKVLLIDNLYALHGRTAVSAEDAGRGLERRSYIWGAAS
ncbi:hypothetical protein [Microbacterium trichothecenolyticum]|uniref:Alpha-ketoglutarate-dependent taurine dioxygenase n=1 Tax=Microbacterium trichothecenolyticum TaxID=69370 RepID=A0ABU0TYZ3_MICTR|nr:hypothetical protein [Microbacterium trichothecenolyticum]MDQ1124880.1 alpha-ketoglutarate-dependent taurine dioxygenase [Microbacterium trichothecenolyticum]